MVCLKTLSVFLAAFAVADARAVFKTQSNKNGEMIADNYIVVMKDGVSHDDFKAHVSSVASIHTTNKAKRGTNTAGMKREFDIMNWRGYHGHFDRDTLEEILNDSKVSYVEQDQVVRISGLTTQRSAPSWGLGRVSHRRAGSRDYVFDDSAGRGVTIYGVDTGIDIRHQDFGGRARWGTNTADRDNADRHGHGTHTASTFAGTAFGIAKNANIVAVKVLGSDGSGSTSGIIAGINYCVQDAQQRGILGKAAMNLSLGGGFSQANNDAVTRAQNAGIFVAVAAGNDNRDARAYSPASAPAVCTVASSTIQDSKSSFSNWGSIVDIYAPGSDIIAARPGGGSQSMSGTSMASPHVAGMGAYLIGMGADPRRVCDQLKQLSTPAISNPGSGTTNRLLYNGSGQ
ncbi:oryzin [Nannizzia gypsea CBS 118893]|uniref:Subtilisin-like protease 4 n=1 Tax=Arthroderma gypseum (strain ATCC MYA-4604 / CBS 118893) TaxID=535722 RepID=SUB4_ARTGP|nr:oryzin [Nannizzia gypsea CBS 118893]E4UWA4.1 RecName: Full=Subtilisin-like protease 4; Flags: Precursor [Nannizzia gypsea CBS 118893]EFR01712.1 oryzin [Nannizzia gypsea CBS 118893]